MTRFTTVWWLTRANELQLKQKHANRQNKSKLGKYPHQLDKTCVAFRKCAANTHNTNTQMRCTGPVATLKGKALFIQLYPDTI